MLCRLILSLKGIVLITLFLNCIDAYTQPSLETPPKILWKFIPPSGASFTASPVADQNLVYVGSFDSTFYALDIKTGGVRWKLRTGGPIKSTATLMKDHVLFYSGDGALYNVNASNGKVNWKFKTLTGFLGDRLYDPADPYHSSPLVDGTAVYMGSSDGHLYAVDLQSGKQLWRFGTGDIIHNKPVVSEGKIFFGSFDGHLYCLKKETGHLLWKFKSAGHRFFPKGEMMGNPIVSDGIVYIGSRDYTLYAVDAENGFCHWMKSFPGGWALSPIANDSVLYVGTSDDRAVFSLDSKTGRQLWKQDVRFNIIGDINFSDHSIFAGTLMGKLYCLDAKTGKPTWIFTTDGYNKNRLKYFKEDDNFRDDVFKYVQTPLDALNAYVNLGGIYSKPFVSTHVIFLSTYEGTLYCLENKQK